jgi:hypothetical protein
LIDGTEFCSGDRNSLAAAGVAIFIFVAQNVAASATADKFRPPPLKHRYVECL